jgi:hypothetical protein
VKEHHIHLALLAATAALACRHPMTGLAGTDGGDAGGGGQDAGAEATPGDASAEVPPSDTATPAVLCPSVPWESPRALALVVASEDEITFVRADGARQVVYRATAEVSSFQVRVAGKLVFVTGYESNPAETHFEAAALEHDGQVRWRYRTVLPESRYPHHVFVDARGAAAFGLRDRLETTIAVLPDGLAYELPGVSPLGVPDDDGWLPVTRVNTPPPAHDFVGFMQMGMTEPVPLTRPRLWSPTPLVLGGARTGLVYLGEENGHWTLFEEYPDQVRGFPLPVPVSEQWFHVDRLAGVVLVSPGTVPTPRWLIDLDAGQVHTLPALATPVPASEAGRARVLAAGRWLLGHDGLRPLWRLDTTTRELVTIDLARLAPLVPFDEARYCAAPPVLLDDGRLALGLRGPSFGGFFVGQPGDGAWTRIGPAFSGVDVIGGGRVGGTWILHASSFKDTFCPGPEQWTAPAPGDPAPLFGVGQYLVPPPPTPPLMLPVASGLHSLHSSGLCGVIDGQVIDLPTGQKVPLPPGATIAWP